MSLSARCDGHDDCGDKADEMHCETLPETPEKHSLNWPLRPQIPVNLTLNLVMIEGMDEAKFTLTAWLQVGVICGVRPDAPPYVAFLREAQHILHLI